MKNKSYIIILLTLLLGIISKRVSAQDGIVQNKRTIHVATAGTLPSLISEDEKNLVEELTLTGKLNGTDFKKIRKMANTSEGKLTTLDLSNVSIVGGGKPYIADDDPKYEFNYHDNLSWYEFYTQDNHITPYLFTDLKLETIVLPNSVTSIDQCAFWRCNSLVSIVIPDNVTSIGNEAFSVCRSLTSVTIGNSVTSIGESAFLSCTGLTSVTIPNSVTSIGERAFYNCTGLTSIVSEIENPFEISKYVFFSGNTNVYSTATLIVPVGLKPAYQSTTGWNNFIKIVEAGEIGQVFQIDGIFYMIGENNTVSVTSGNTKCFGGVVIPDQVTFFGTKYTVTSIGSYAFSGCSGLTSITIPNSVTSIGDYAFSGCSDLASVTIGSGVKSIGKYVFSGTNVKKTIWLTNTPPFGYTYANGTINYVSNNQFSSLGNKVVYQFLSSIFEVDGVKYVPVSPSERTCDAIDCVYNELSANTKIASTVTYKGISMTVNNMQPCLAYNNEYIKTLSIDYDGEISNYAFSNCLNLEITTLGKRISKIGDSSFRNCL